MREALTRPDGVLVLSDVVRDRRRSAAQQHALELLEAVVPDPRIASGIAATARCSSRSRLGGGEQLVVDPGLDQVDVRLAVVACAMRLDAGETLEPGGTTVAVGWTLLQQLRSAAERGAAATGETVIEWTCRQLLGTTVLGTTQLKRP